MISNDFNFEKAIKELEDIANALEDENTTIDRSVELFQKGVSLSKECSQYLENVKQKITSLTEAEGEEKYD